MPSTPEPDWPNAPSSFHAAGILPRRGALQVLATLGIGSVTFQRALAAQVENGQKITPEMVAQAEWVAGIELDDDERQDVASSLARNLNSARRLREMPVDADQVPAVVFRPDFFYEAASQHAASQPPTAVEPVEQPAGESATPLKEATPSAPESGEAVKQPEAHPLEAEPAETRPAQTGRTGNMVQLLVNWESRDVGQLSDEQLAFSGIVDQASLLAEGRISSRELTQLYLRRLKKYDPLLLCMVTLLEEPALEQAEASDKRRRQGRTRGILDGIPWLAKDLIAVPPWKTTWGAEPFRDQVRPTTATVAAKLEAAGSVLLGKTTLGALAWGDRWFGGMTRNPWNPEQGSSGSSAGSASAMAAGLATFALGSETLGSIVSPCRRCRTSGLRPTFGRVSRAGCMPLAWSMDKIGPITRHVEDLAYVFPHLLGADGKDPTVVEKSYVWPGSKEVSDLRVGITGERLNKTEQQALDFLQSAGASIVELDLDVSVPEGAMSFILGVEASTVFDDAFRADPKADYGRWPSTFRQSQFVPAIQYLRANRLRSQLIQEAEAKLSQVDVVLGADDLLLTNLSGHPSVVVACGSDKSDEIRLPGVVKLTAAAYREADLLLAGRAVQAAIPAEPGRPPLDDWLAKRADQQASADAPTAPDKPDLE